ncbi:Rft-1-domain-containing protein [Lichtheimia hyalospora FSU 10163]|nr:Rft-1-domain-containing protein [Lichtheimia hyalospora FSU 10163]
MATKGTINSSVQSTGKSNDNNDNLLASTAKGAYYLVLLQFSSRMLTFGLHQIVLRYTTAETLGIASVKLELLLSTILFISREGFRCALLRGGSEEKERSDSEKEQEEQKVTNLAYIPTAIGLITTLLACGYYLSTIDDATSFKYPYYRTSVILFGAAAFAELLVEPLFVLAMNRLYFSLRVSVEGVAVLVRCFITFGMTLLGATSSHNAYGVLAFAVAQMAFGLIMMIGYFAFFINKVQSRHMKMSSLFPQKLKASNGRSYYFDKPMLNLASTLTKQSLLKHVLTEGDKMLISAICSDNDQGIYAFVVNYGSLIVRILFQPLEETTRTLFSKLLSNGDKNKSSMQTAANVLLMTLRGHMLLGLLFTCFATNYTATLIDLLVGKEWSIHRNAPAVLSVYCMYVPIMGVNGVTEGFVQAVATKKDLSRLSYYMIGFSACFMVAGYIFMHVLDLGAIGLVLANMVNLSIRIAYSWNYISCYFGDTIPQLRIRNWFPSKSTIVAFMVAWGITRWSEQIVGWSTLQQKAIHIGIGGLCALIVAGITVWKEKSWIRDIKQLARSRKKEE